MFEFTESIRIEAPVGKVWKHLVDVEAWWLPSNPDHIGLEVRSANDRINVGTEVVFEERVAGIKGQATGTIKNLIDGEEITWESTAEYRYLGFLFQIQEGVSWQVESDTQTSTLAARVWAKFPSSIVGRIFEWYAKSVLDIVDRDREHARRELAYLKRVIEDAR
jgi:hypothetical protein